jgi:hypothetical protein
MEPKVQNGKPTKRFWGKEKLEDSQCVNVNVLKEGRKAFGDQLSHGVFLEEFFFNDNWLNTTDCYNNARTNAKKMEEFNKFMDPSGVGELQNFVEI